MYHKIKSDFVHESVLSPILIYFSKLIGHYYDSEQSKYQIKQFIQDYNIDMKIIDKEEINSWKNFNQFFSRRANLNYRPLEIDSYNTVVSPADSRIMAFQKNKYMDQYVGHSKFNIKQLIPLLKQNEWDKLSQGSGVICRLAPQDLHHIFCGFNGYIKEIMVAGNKLFSVNPVCLKSPYVNILADNIRAILLINNPELNVTYYMIIIGATFVGSIKFTNEKIQQAYDYLISNNKNKYTFTKPITVERGQDMGYFLYGGSTVALMFDRQIEFNDSIKNFSLFESPKINRNKQIESYYYARSKIGELL